MCTTRYILTPYKCGIRTSNPPRSRRLQSLAHNARYFYLARRNSSPHRLLPLLNPRHPCCTRLLRQPRSGSIPPLPSYFHYPIFLCSLNVGGKKADYNPLATILRSSNTLVYYKNIVYFGCCAGFGGRGDVAFFPCEAVGGRRRV